MREVLQIILTATTSGTNGVQVVTPRVPAGHLWKVTFLAFQNNSGGPATAALALISDGQTLQLTPPAVVPNASSLNLFAELWLREQQQLGVYLSGVNNLGPVTLLVMGLQCQNEIEEILVIAGGSPQPTARG